MAAKAAWWDVTGPETGQSRPVLGCDLPPSRSRLSFISSMLKDREGRKVTRLELLWNYFVQRLLVALVQVTGLPAALVRPRPASGAEVDST